MEVDPDGIVVGIKVAIGIDPGVAVGSTKATPSQIFWYVINGGGFPLPQIQAFTLPSIT